MQSQQFGGNGRTLETRGALGKATRSTAPCTLAAVDAGAWAPVVEVKVVGVVVSQNISFTCDQFLSVLVDRELYVRQPDSRRMAGGKHTKSTGSYCGPHRCYANGSLSDLSTRWKCLRARTLTRGRSRPI